MITRISIAAPSLWVAIGATVLVSGCAARHASSGAATPPPASAGSTAAATSPAGGPAGGAPYAAPTRMAFGFDARVLLEETGSRKMKMRFYGQAPDRFRIEVRGPVGGIALIVTGSQRRIRLVIPSRRRYAEGDIDADLAAGLLGVPMSGCDLAMVVRISAGFKKFHPCGDDSPADDTPISENDRPGVIVDTSVTGEELVRFGWDWSGEGAFPKEMRVESRAPTNASLALTNFKALEAPASPAEDFFWEPLPDKATQVSFEDLGKGVEP